MYNNKECVWELENNNNFYFYYDFCEWISERIIILIYIKSKSYFKKMSEDK